MGRKDSPTITARFGGGSMSMLQSHMLKHNQKRLLPTGKCFWCKEKTEKESDIYCCVECGEDYERFKKANPHM